MIPAGLQRRSQEEEILGLEARVTALSKSLRPPALSTVMPLFQQRQAARSPPIRGNHRRREGGALPTQLLKAHRRHTLQRVWVTRFELKASR